MRYINSRFTYLLTYLLIEQILMKLAKSGGVSWPRNAATFKLVLETGASRYLTVMFILYFFICYSPIW